MSLKRRLIGRTPKVSILEPLAATSAPEAGKEKDLAGNTETSAPLSIKKCFPELLSLIDIVSFPALIEDTDRRGREEPGANAARRGSFPEPAPPTSSGKTPADHTGKHLVHSECEYDTSLTRMETGQHL